MKLFAGIALLLSLVAFSCYVTQIESASVPCSAIGLNTAASTGGNVSFACTTPTNVPLNTGVTFNNVVYLDGRKLLTLIGQPQIVTFTLQNDLGFLNINFQQIHVRNNAGRVYFVNCTFSADYVNETLPNIIHNGAFIFFFNSMVYNSRSYGAFIKNNAFFYIQSSTITSEPIITFNSSAIDTSGGVILDIIFSTLTGFSQAVYSTPSNTIHSVGNIIIGRVTSATYTGNFNILTIPNPGFGIGQFPFNQFSVDGSTLLGALSPTAGYAMKPCSPAINGASPAELYLPTEDQNGRVHNSQGAPDIGAIESDLLPCLFINASQNVSEGVGVFNIFMQLSGASWLDAAVDYLVTDGTAENGLDYNNILPSQGRYTFFYPNTIQQLDIQIVDNNFYSDAAALFFFVRFFNSTPTVTYAEQTLQYSIINDDPYPITQFNEIAVVIPEDISGGLYHLPFNLSNPSRYGIEVNITVTPGTAVQGVNLVSDPAYFLRLPSYFATGAQSDVAIRMVNDNVYVGNKTFSVDMIAAVNATLGPKGHINAIITDDGDFPQVNIERGVYYYNESSPQPVIRVTLNHPSIFDVYVPFELTFLGARTNATYPQLMFLAVTTDLYFNPLNTTNFIYLNIINDLIHEDNEYFVLSLKNPVGAALGTQYTANITLFDDDVPYAKFTQDSLTVNETTGIFSITVEISNAALDPIVVYFEVVTLTASLGPDFVVLTSSPIIFQPNVFNRTIEFQVFNDSIREYTETFRVNLLSATNGGAIATTNNSLLVSIIDTNEDPTVTFDFSNFTNGNNFEVVENVTYLDIPMVLSHPTAFPAVVNVTTNYTFALGGAYFSTPAQQSFLNYTTRKMLRIEFVDNNIQEPNRTIYLSLTSAVFLFLGNQLNASIHLLDNDPVPALDIISDGVILSSRKGKIKTTEVNIMFSSLTTNGVYAKAKVEGTAVEGTDYTITDTAFQFDPLANMGTITVTTLSRQTKSKDPIFLLLSIENSVNASKAEKQVKIEFDESYLWGLKDGERYAIFACGGAAILAAGIIVTVLLVRKFRLKKTAKDVQSRVDSGSIEMSRFKDR